MGLITFNKKKVTLRINSEELMKLRQRYANYTDSDGKIIQTCVEDCIMNQAFWLKSKRKRTAYETYKFVSCNRDVHDTIVSVRLECSAIDFIGKYYHADENYDIKPCTTTAIRCCIADVCDDVSTHQKLTFKDSIMYMMGQKNPTMLKFLEESFASVRAEHDINGYIELFGGTANVLLHMDTTDVEYLNDNSIDLIGLLKTIKEYPYFFKLALWQLGLSRESFKFAKEFIKTTKKTIKDNNLPTKSYRFKVEYYTYFFYMRYLSFMGTGHTFLDSKTLEAYRKHLDLINLLSERLANVNIKKRDAVYFGECLWKKFNIRNHIVYIDSPYLCTENYYKMNRKDKSTFDNHRGLRNLAEKLRGNGNYVFISYRITASETMKNKGTTSEKICKRLDELYCNRGFYYRLQPLPNGQVEILLSTVELQPSTEYDKPLTEKEVVL